MKILFLSAEVGPFASVGGLSQVMYFLPRALKKYRHDAHIFTPKYGSIRLEDAFGKTLRLRNEISELKVPVQMHVQKIQKKDPNIQCNVKVYKSSKQDPVVHFLENREYYELRANVFGYGDDHIRFALLSKACLEWLLQMKEKSSSRKSVWFPNIIHCNDWHTAYFIELARRDRRYKSLLAKIPILFTIHNFSFQGNIGFKYIPHHQQDDGSEELVGLLSPKLLRQNALLRGILHADSINTVSQTHAQEVLTPEYGEGLEQTLQKVRGKITGILNGLDVNEFDPATDPIIKRRYNAKSVYGARKFNKLDLQKTFLLPEDPNKVVIVINGRIGRQKGWDLILETLPHVFAYEVNAQVIVLGDAEEAYRGQLIHMQKEFSDRFAIHLRRDFRLPRKLYAGGDIILIPSLFEPGGIVALEALRYGTVPIVRATGGLADIITHYDPESGKGNGFVFRQINPWVLYGKIIEAITLHKRKTVWNRLVQNCMMSDFSWDHAAQEYHRLYHNIITQKKRAISFTPHQTYKISQQ